jgi:hypothetical protein
MMLPATKLVVLLADYLMAATKQQDFQQDSLVCFYAKKVPTITLVDFLGRILLYSKCDSDCILSVLVYLERLANGDLFLNKGVVNMRNVHRLLITAVMVSLKFTSDVFCTNVHMSKVGGIPVHELNFLEVQFLLHIDFRLRVDANDLSATQTKLLEAACNVFI